LIHDIGFQCFRLNFCQSETAGGLESRAGTLKEIELPGPAMEIHGALSESSPKLERTADQRDDTAADMENEAGAKRPKVLEIGRVEAEIRQRVVHDESP